ncbi:hypothetical protein JRQ81_013078 [Phrynocephalus forsythii]|uniref:Uncharacterized protein n=1 Tax=Phrynocephalus forsythii TaxID=171643 RepID=A0A9Q0XZ51_9SAUR|nr:hypothetical protein JRQ81_013078 [Phrynocephalus forsythii]
MTRLAIEEQHGDVTERTQRNQTHPSVLLTGHEFAFSGPERQKRDPKGRGRYGWLPFSFLPQPGFGKSIAGKHWGFQTAPRKLPRQEQEQKEEEQRQVPLPKAKTHSVAQAQRPERLMAGSACQRHPERPFGRQKDKTYELTT